MGGLRLGRAGAWRSKGFACQTARIGRGMDSLLPTRSARSGPPPLADSFRRFPSGSSPRVSAHFRATFLNKIYSRINANEHEFAKETMREAVRNSIVVGHDNALPTASRRNGRLSACATGPSRCSAFRGGWVSQDFCGSFRDFCGIFGDF